MRSIFCSQLESVFIGGLCFLYNERHKLKTGELQEKHMNKKQGKEGAT